jgi:phosphocarrier protein HPr
VSPEKKQTVEDEGVLTREVVVLNRYGIHARPAALLVKAAARFDCEIMIEKNGVQVNAKSIMGLLTLEGNHGATLQIHASGHDAKEALIALAELFEKKFFED